MSKLQATPTRVDQHAAIGIAMEAGNATRVEDGPVGDNGDEALLVLVKHVPERVDLTVLALNTILTRDSHESAGAVRGLDHGL